jgi:hypothetical protein
MKASVYVETTIVSYLVAEPTKDLIQAAHQQITREWWAARDRFDLFVSAAVVAEARCRSRLETGPKRRSEIGPLGTGKCEGERKGGGRVKGGATASPSEVYP